MVWRVQRAPAWVLGIAQGLFFTVVFGLGTALAGGEPLRSTLPMAVIAGAVFGALMGPTTARIRRQQWAGVPAVATEDQQRQAARVLSRGPVPSDPVVRAVAVHVLRQRLAAARRGRAGQVVVFVVLIVLCAVQVVTSTRWWSLGVVFFGVFFVLTLLEPWRLTRRLEVLTQ